MKANYLFPNKFKRIGWLILIPSAIFGILMLIFNYEPAFLDFKVPAIFVNEFFGDKYFLGMVRNNILNEIIGVLTIISLLLVAFSKEKTEDEYIYKIRLESLVWAVYVNYGILLFCFLFIFGGSFLWVMVFNMFTVLLFFILRFNWKIARLRKSSDYEK
ncbi:MAG: hypothetical protein EA362_12635 [Saprospirales bacterium]|nr:MAG: hypothetical protein EA362_12635 [Saprospirales bacterium]